MVYFAMVGCLWAIIDHNDGIGSKERILCGPGAVGNQTSNQYLSKQAAGSADGMQL